MAKVLTAYYISPESFKKCMENLPARASVGGESGGVPFYRFRPPGVSVDQPVYDTNYDLTQWYPFVGNAETGIGVEGEPLPVRWYLKEGAIAVFISKVFMKGLPGDPNESEVTHAEEVENYAMVRLIHGVSAFSEKAYDSNIDQEIFVNPTINTFADGKAEDIFGLIDIRHFDSIVIDPTTEDVAIDYSDEALEDLRPNLPAFTINIDSSEVKDSNFWWLPKVYNNYRKREFFSRDQLIKKGVPAERVNWDKNTNYSIKIIDSYGYIEDGIESCNKSTEIKCPLLLIARLPADLNTNKAAIWRDKDSAFGENVFGQGRAEYGYIMRSHLMMLMRGDSQSQMLTVPDAPANNEASRSILPSESDIDRQDVSWFNKTRCKYYVKLTTAYDASISGYASFLENSGLGGENDPKLSDTDKYFDLEIRLGAFRSLLQENNKVGASTLDAWINEESDEPGLNKNARKALYTAFEKTQIELKQVSQTLMGKIECIVAVPSSEFDKIPEKPASTSYVLRGSDYQYISRFYLEKKGISLKQILEKNTIPLNPISSFRPTIDDIFDLGQFFGNDVHSNYMNEFKEHITLINIDFSLEGSNLTKFSSALRVLFAENNVDVETFSSDAYVEVGFNSSFLPTIVLYDKGDGTGTYKFNKGLQNFKNFASSKRTNQIVFDISTDKLVGAEGLGGEFGRNMALIEKLHMLRKTINENTSKEQTAGVRPVNQAYTNLFKALFPIPKTKIKRSRASTRTSDRDKRPKPLSRGRKTLKQVKEEDRSIKATIKNQRDKRKKGSIFSKETNKSVADFVKTKSHFNLILDSKNFLGKNGVYERVMKNTNINVFLKDLMECAGFDLKGDDLFEIICNQVLQALPMEDIKKEVLDGLDEASGELQTFIEDSIDDLYEDLSSEDFDPNKFMNGLGEVLKYSDFNYDPLLRKDKELAEALGAAGKKAVHSSDPKSSNPTGGVSTSIGLACDEDTLSGNIPGQLVPGANPSSTNVEKINIPYLLENSSQIPGCMSSGDQVYIWKVYLNFKFSQEQAGNPNIANLIFSDDDFKKYKTKYTEKTSKATVEYTNLFNQDDELGKKGIVSKKAYEKASTWWAASSGGNIAKYQSDLNAAAAFESAANRVKKDNIKEILSKKLAKSSSITLEELLSGQQLSVRYQKSFKSVGFESTAVTHLVTLSLEPAGTSPTETNTEVLVGELLTSSDDPESSKATELKARELAGQISNSTFSALKELGLNEATAPIVNFVSDAPPTTIKSSTMVEKITTANSTAGTQTINHKGYLSDISVPQNWAEAKGQLDGLIRNGAFDQEGQKRLLMGMCKEYEADISNFVAKHLTPEYLCGRLEGYILDFISALKDPGAALEAGLGFKLPDFKGITLDGVLKSIGHLWLAAVMKAIDQSLLELSKWAVRYIQLNCELAMAEASEALAKEIAKIDSKFLKGVAEFGAGLVNMKTDIPVEQATNIVTEVDAIAHTSTQNITADTDLYKVQKGSQQDLAKTNVMTTYTSQFLGLIKNQDMAKKIFISDEEYESAIIQGANNVPPQTINSLMAQLLMTLKAKELILLFRGDASPELLKNVLIFIEERYPTINTLIDTPGAVASLFGFIGEHIDIDLLVGSLTVKSAIEDACELEQYDRDLNVISSQAALALEEEIRRKKNIVNKTVQLMMDNGLTTKSIKPVKPPASDFIDFNSHSSFAMRLVRDSMLDFVSLSYRSDVKKLRSTLFDFNMSMGAEGEQPEGGSFGGNSPSKLYQEFLDSMPNLFSGNNEDSPIKFNLNYDVFPELKNVLRGDDPQRQTYNLAYNDNETTEKADFVSNSEQGSNFKNFYEKFMVKEKQLNGDIRRNTKFAYGLLIDDFIPSNPEADPPIGASHNFLLLDPPGSFPTYTGYSIDSEKYDQEYHVAVIKDNKTAFYWSMGPLDDPTEFSDSFLQTTIPIFTYGDPCNIKDEVVPHTMEEFSEYKPLPDDSYPELKDPLLGNVADAFPMDNSSLNLPSKGAPAQARMFSRYVTAITSKNLSSNKKGLYVAEGDNSLKNIEDIETVLESYVFPRFSLSIIQSYGEYLSRSRYFKTAELFKVTKSICDPRKTAFDMLKLEEIKDYIARRYGQINRKMVQKAIDQAWDLPQNQGKGEPDPLGGVDPLSEAMLEAVVKLTIRTFLAEILIRGMWIFDRFKFEEVLGSGMFLNLFAAQIENSIGGLIPGRDPKVFKNLFMRECRNLVDFYWSSESFGIVAEERERLSVFERNTIRNNDKKLIKYLAAIEIKEVGGDMNKIFGRDPELMKDVKEIFFDSLNYGFIRNDGSITIGTSNIGQEVNMHSSVALTNYDPDINLDDKDQYDKLGGTPGDSPMIEFSNLSKQQFADGSKLIMNGNFMIEPYIRLVDIEKRQGDIGIDPDTLPYTVFDHYFGPDSEMAIQGGDTFNSYKRPNKYRGMLAIQDLENFANELKLSVMINDPETLPEKNPLNYTLSLFYKEIKYGVRLSMVLPTSADDGFDKMEEIFNKLVDDAEYGNQFVPQIHKAYRVYKEIVTGEGDNVTVTKKPLYILPLINKEVDAKEGAGSGINEFAGISVASDLYNKTWDELATVYPKNHFLKVSRRVEYPSDSDIVRIKYNMGYADPDYASFADEFGNVVPLPIYPDVDVYNQANGSSVETHIFLNAEALGYQTTHAKKDDGVEIGGKGIVDAQKKLNGHGLYQISKRAEYAYGGEFYAGGDNEGHSEYQTTFADKGHIARAFAAYNHLLVTQFARNEFAQWMGIGVDLDEETHYSANFNRIPASITRPSAETATKNAEDTGAINFKAGYHPELYPGLIGRPDFNVEFTAEWNSPGEEGSYPHGPYDNKGCKKFTSADYNELGFGQSGVNQLSSYNAANYSSPEYPGLEDEAKFTDANGNLVDADDQTSNDYNQILIADFNKNMATFNMSRCRKSPRYDQPGADYPGGKEAIGQMAFGDDQNVYMMPTKYNISEVFPPHKYEFTSVPTLDNGEYLEKVIFQYTKTILDKTAHGRGLIYDYYETLCGDLIAGKSKVDEEKKKWLQCKNAYTYGDNSYIRQAAQSTEYKHPGGMPLVVKHVSNEKSGIHNTYVDEYSHVFSGIYADKTWNDWQNSAAYKKSVDSMYKYFFSGKTSKAFANEQIFNLKSQFTFNGYDVIQVSKFNYAPVRDNIPVQVYAASIWGKGPTIVVGSPALDYLSFNPKISDFNFKGSLGSNENYLSHTKPYLNNASSLEASQIWVKNADSIDFRELANKKTDYILQKLGFMQPFWIGNNRGVMYADSPDGANMKNIPIFDKSLVINPITLLDKKLVKDPETNKPLRPELAWDIEGDVDIISEDADQFDPIVAPLLEDDLKTPEQFKKYPRSRIDTWNIKITHHSNNVWKTPSVDELYNEGVLVHNPETWITSQDGVKKIKKEKYNLVIDGDMVMSKEELVGRRKLMNGILTDYSVIDTDKEIQDLVGEDTFVGLFPDGESIQNIREIFVEIGNDPSAGVYGPTKNGFGGLNKFHELGGNNYTGEAAKNEMFKIEIKGLGEINGPAEKGTIGDNFGDIISKYFAGPSTHWKQTATSGITGNPPYYPTAETLSNPLSVNSGMGNTIGPDGTLKSSNWLQKMMNHGGMRVEDIVSNPFYYAFGSEVPGNINSKKWTHYDELPPELKKYYSKGKHGHPAINMTVTSANGTSRTIKLYQVAVRAPDLMKLGNNFDFGAKFEIASEPSSPDDPSIWFDEFFMGTGDTSIYGHLRREMLESQEFKLLFNYVFPLREFASTVSMYVLFYGFYNNNSFLNKISSKLFSNTKSSLMSLFDMLSSGGDPYREYYPNSTVTAAMQALKVEDQAANGLADPNEETSVAEQIYNQSDPPGFLSTAGDFDIDGDGLTNARVIMEIFAGFTDPGFDFFPITPFGWAALWLRQLEKDRLNGKDEEVEGDVFSVAPYSNPDTDLCDNE